MTGNHPAGPGPRRSQGTQRAPRTKAAVRTAATDTGFAKWLKDNDLGVRYLATAATLLAFTAALAFLWGEAAKTSAPDLSTVAPAVVTALLGAVVNPGKSIGRWLWGGVAVFALAAVGYTGWVAFWHADKHPAAVSALSACVAAFAGLIVNTDKWTQSGKTDPAQNANQ